MTGLGRAAVVWRATNGSFAGELVGILLDKVVCLAEIVEHIVESPF
jgi:hypothetical protein